MGRNPDGWGRKPHKWRGRWRAYLTVGYDGRGKPIRQYIYGKTEAECGERLLDARAQHQRGTQPADRSLTVRAYLAEWLTSKEAEVTSSTIRIYRNELAHALPHLGRVKLVDLTPLHIERMMRSINGQTVTFNQKQQVVLTARAANKARTVLGNALSDAVRLGVLPTNPVDRTRPMRHRKAAIQVWDAQQVARFLDTCQVGAAAQYALFYAALTTGLRVGELQALEWRDVDRTTIHVRRTAGADGTKTTAGVRVVPLPADTRDVIRTYRQALAGEGVESELVFPTGSGRMATRQNIRKGLHRWADRAGVQRLRMHDLRHTYASMMIANGANPAELARLLGHTNPAFTLREYVHFFERAQRREAPTLRDLMGEPQGGTLGGRTALPN